MNMVKLADWILTRIADEGVRNVFFVPGGAAMHLNDALRRTPGLSFVGTFHEHAAAVAAESYAKLTNHLGVAMVTAGPGSTNAITGVASAWVNSAPLLVLSGQVKLADLNPGGLRQCGLQEIDIMSIIKPITKYSATITDVSTARFHLEKAIYLARNGRPGPTWLCLPLDVQAMLVDPDSQQGFAPENGRSTKLDNEVDRLIELLNQAERPVILAGGGIRISGAGQKFLELANLLGIPVQTTWVGVDVMASDHPLFAGRPGSFASRASNFTIQNCDLMLSLGARLDFATTGFSRQRFARAAKRVAVDIDSLEIEKMRDILDLGIVASAGEVIERLLQKRSKIAPRVRKPWLDRVRQWADKYPVVAPEPLGCESVTSTYALIKKLGQLLEESDVIVEGSAGIHSEIFFMAFNNKHGQRVVADGSYGSMGYGLPAAIGACLAAGRTRTVLVEGDGSLQPNLQELETIAREKLPLKIIVVNNGGYSSIRVSQSRYFQHLVGADPTSGLTLPVVSRIAEAYGIRSVRINCAAELDAKLREALDGDDPVLCDIVVPMEEDRVPRLSNAQRADGTMVSKPMEDMFPFLSRDEFLENMLIQPLEDD